MDLDDPVPHDSASGEAVESAIRHELEQVLDGDESRLGDVFRMSRQNRTPAEIAQELGVPTAGFVYGVRREIDAVLHGVVPTSPNTARQAASRVRGLLKHQELSSGARDHLTAVLGDLEHAAQDIVKQQEEDEQAVALTEQAEKKNVPGVYVYSLPHYLRHPYHPDSRHTLFKVGHSSVDVFNRLGNQGRTTALPEDPVLLRIYSSADETSNASEKRFHEALEAADHARNRSSRAGREWFLTSTKYLDFMAKQFGMDVVVVSDLDVGEV